MLFDGNDGNKIFFIKLKMKTHWQSGGIKRNSKWYKPNREQGIYRINSAGSICWNRKKSFVFFLEHGGGYDDPLIYIRIRETQTHAELGLYSRT